MGGRGEGEQGRIDCAQLYDMYLSERGFLKISHFDKAVHAHISLFTFFS